MNVSQNLLPSDNAPRTRHFCSLLRVHLSCSFRQVKVADPGQVWSLLGLTSVINDDAMNIELSISHVLIDNAVLIRIAFILDVAEINLKIYEQLNFKPSRNWWSCLVKLPFVWVKKLPSSLHPLPFWVEAGVWLLGASDLVVLVGACPECPGSKPGEELLGVGAVLLLHTNVNLAGWTHRGSLVIWKKGITIKFDQFSTHSPRIMIVAWSN